MKDSEIINKRLILEKLKGSIITEIHGSEGDDDISYDDCVQVLLSIVDILQVHKGYDK